jgi:hypothetical protein
VGEIHEPRAREIPKRRVQDAASENEAMMFHYFFFIIKNWLRSL